MLSAVLLPRATAARLLQWRPVVCVKADTLPMLGQTDRRMDGRTDVLTDTITLHKPCCAFAGSANNRNRNPNFEHCPYNSEL